MAISEVLAGLNPLDRPPAFGLILLGMAHQRSHVHDPLSLFARDLGPVVRVGRVGQVLVFTWNSWRTEATRSAASTPRTAGQLPFDGQLL